MAFAYWEWLLELRSSIYSNVAVQQQQYVGKRVGTQSVKKKGDGVKSEILEMKLKFNKILWNFG